MKSISSSQEQHKLISQIFTNKNVIKSLTNEIAQIHALYDDKYTIVITNQDPNLLIYLHPTKLKSDTTDGSINSDQYLQNSYVIKISKAYPISGVRFHLIKCINLQPAINDCRDLMYEVLGEVWNYKQKLREIINRISNFQEKLSCRNENYLALQKTGQFQIGDVYTKQQLKKFSAIDIFENFGSDSDKFLLGTTQTHLLKFKQLKKQSYFLCMACQLQCIKQIQKSKEENYLLLNLFKYRKIKNYYEHEKIVIRCYLFEEQLFMRNILKALTKLQKVHISLSLADSWKKQQSFEGILQKIQECQELEQNDKKKKNQRQKSDQRYQTFKRLGKNYQKIIQYFSARASCYYLIYVHKLNNLFVENKEFK